MYQGAVHFVPNGIVSLAQFDLLRSVGRGAFGKVFSQVCARARTPALSSSHATYDHSDEGACSSKEE